MLHFGPSKLRRFIADGSLRVRDPRISAISLLAVCEKRKSSTEAESAKAIHHKLRNNPNPYSWGSAAKLLGVDVEQLRKLIVRGELKIVDAFVTERAFQDFCKINGSQLNAALLGDDVRDWLIEGYSLRVSTCSGTPPMPGNQKHALITRRCPGCRRPMRGNIFFKHVKSCKAAGSSGKHLLLRTMPGEGSSRFSS
jgi:hypothetical protein